MPKEWSSYLSIRTHSPLRSLRMIGNDAVENQIVLLVLFKIIPETVNIYIRKSLKDIPYQYLIQSVVCQLYFSYSFLESIFSHIFSCISSRMWFIISNLSLVLLPSVSTSRNLDLYSRLCEKNIIHRLTLVGGSE